jgi:peptidyl-prolyl cis-trans isomerase D
MLKIMRDKAQSKLIKLLLWAVIVSFIASVFLIWGRGTESLEGNPNIVARAGDIEIDRYTFLERYNVLAAEAKDKQSRLKAAQEVILSFIRTEFLKKQAEELDITVSSKELFSYIMDYRDRDGNYIFRDENGNFIGEVLYKRIINNSRQSVSSFEAAVKQELLLQKIQNLLIAGVDVTDQEALDYYKLNNEKVELKVGNFNIEDFKDKVVATESDLEKYFSEKKEDFRKPAMNKYEVVVIPLSPYLQRVKVDNKEARSYFETHIEDYYTAEQRQSRHILFRLERDADEGEEKKVRETAERILKLAESGENFATLATRFSEDEATAANGGFLNYSTKGTMQKPFDDALFDMKIGEIRGPVKTLFGYHIIKLDDIKLAGYKEFQEVKEQVIEKLRSLKADDLRENEVGEIEERLKGSDEWGNLANELKLSFSTTDYIAPGVLPSGVPYSREIFQALSDLDIGDMTERLKGGEDVMYLKLIDTRPSYIPSLDEVLGQVERKYKEEQAKLLAEKTAAEAVDKINMGDPFDPTVTALAGSVSESEPIARKDQIPKIGRNPQLIHAVFRSNKGEIVGPFEHQRGYVIAKVEDKEEIDFNMFLRQSEFIKQQLLQKKQNNVSMANIETVAGDTPIILNNKLLQEIID